MSVDDDFPAEWYKTFKYNNINAQELLYLCSWGWEDSVVLEMSSNLSNSKNG